MKGSKPRPMNCLASTSKPRAFGGPTAQGTAPTDVSVVICCFDSERRLPEVLRHLLEQKLDEAIRWEVIVVDNASRDATAAVARRCWPEAYRAPLRVVSEPMPGLVHARRAGLAAARGAIVSFVDDDNWVCSTWIRVVADVFTAHPQVAACGGRGVAVFEGAEPSWFRDFERAYAVGPQSSQAGYVGEERGYLSGAGLSIRRDALSGLFDAGFKQLNLGRRGKALSAGEDVEICLALRLAGWQLYFHPDLVFQHYMPAHRLTYAYLRQLQFGCGVAEANLAHYRYALGAGPASRPAEVASFLALRECYWAALRLFRRLGRMAFVRRNERPALPDLYFLLGAFWGTVRVGGRLARDRAQVLAFAETLRARTRQ